MDRAPGHEAHWAGARRHLEPVVADDLARRRHGLVLLRLSRCRHQQRPGWDWTGGRRRPEPRRSLGIRSLRSDYCTRCEYTVLLPHNTLLIVYSRRSKPTIAEHFQQSRRLSRTCSSCSPMSRRLCSRGRTSSSGRWSSASWQYT